MSLRTATGALACALVVLGSTPAAAPSWKPIDPADLKLAAPRIDPRADAETLLWEVHVRDQMGFIAETTFEHYLRIKVFTDRGRDMHATVDVPYRNGMRVVDLAARTIKPDGTVIEAKSSDIYKRTIVKADEVTVKVISIPVPGLERGAILEFRWKEIHSPSIMSYLPLPLSRDIPVHDVQYYIRPLNIPGVISSMQAKSFNVRMPRPQEQKDGWTLFELKDVPAYRQEPYGLPEFERQPWMLIYYNFEGQARSNRWQDFAQGMHEFTRSFATPNDDIKKTAMAAVAGKAGNEDKIIALLKVCRDHVKRVDLPGATDDDKKKLKGEIQSASDTFKRGVGREIDTNLLFIALATAAGMDARLAALTNRAVMFHHAEAAEPVLTRDRIVAVRSPSGWRYVEPANPYTASGALRWQHEQVPVIMADPAEIASGNTPLSPVDASMKRRSARLRLGEDGTIEGEIAIVQTGHFSEQARSREWDDAPADREKAFRDEMTKRLPGVELSDVTIGPFDDQAKPHTVAASLKLPGYGQKTGTRLFFQPGLFEKGLPPVFSASERTDPLNFPFAWSEEDEVTIDLPPGYSLEKPAAPPPIISGISEYEVTMTIVGGNRLVYKRRFSFGKSGSIYFPPTMYQSIKGLFDHVQQNDAQTLLLRRAETTE